MGPSIIPKYAKDGNLADARAPQHGGGVEIAATPLADLPDSTLPVSNVLRQRLEKEGLSCQPSLDLPLRGEFSAIAEHVRQVVAPTMAAEFHSFEHAVTVAERFGRYLREANFPETIARLGELAGLLHDADHPGVRYREDAPGVGYPRLSNEEVAATLAVETLEPYLSTPQLHWVYKTILATSFGQRIGKDPSTNVILEERPHLIRPYVPESLEQKLMHFADVNSTDGTTPFESFVAGGLRLKLETSKAPTNVSSNSEALRQHLVNESFFLKYIKHLADDVGPSLNPEARERINARSNEVEQRLTAVCNRFEGPDAELVKAIAADVFDRPIG